MTDHLKVSAVADKSNIISLAEWRRVQRRLDRMTQRELAMTVDCLIDLVVDLKREVSALKEDGP